eukprot:364426-Chlamydomonas_euryale.AAC.43
MSGLQTSELTDGWTSGWRRGWMDSWADEWAGHVPLPQLTTQPLAVLPPLQLTNQPPVVFPPPANQSTTSHVLTRLGGRTGPQCVSSVLMQA